MIICSSKKAWRPAIVGSPNPGPEEDSGSSNDDSDIEEEDFMSQPSAPKAASLLSSSSALPELLSTMESYGFELKDPSTEDQLLYERLELFICRVCWLHCVEISLFPPSLFPLCPSFSSLKICQTTQVYVCSQR